MFSEIIKYLYPRDIYKLYLCKRYITLSKKYFLYSNKSLSRKIIELYSLPPKIIRKMLKEAMGNPPKVPFLKLNSQDQLFHMNSLSQHVKSYYFPCYQNTYSDITAFQNTNFKFYNITESNDNIKIFCSINRYYSLFHIEYHSSLLYRFKYLFDLISSPANHGSILLPKSNMMEICPLYPEILSANILSTFIVNRISGRVLSQYHWNTYNNLPIGTHLKYNINVNSIKDEKYSYTRLYDNNGYVIALEHNGYEYWNDKERYRKITLKIPKHIESELYKWKQTPISLLEGSYETYDNKVILYKYIKYNSKYNCYQYQFIYEDGTFKDKYINLSNIYYERCEVNIFPNIIRFSIGN